MKSEPSETRGESGASVNSSTRVQSPSLQKRTVCDHCRRRRIRCDGQFPCQQCVSASLHCKRDHVPRKRGPKRGHGRVINELRARDTTGKERVSRESSTDIEGANDEGINSTTISGPSTPPDISWQKVSSDPRNAAEPSSVFSTDQYHPLSRSYHYLVPHCVELYYEHIYPIMPLLHMPTLRDMVQHHLKPSEQNLVYALSALTCFHMSGKSIQAAGPDSWEKAGRFFLDECLSVRQNYDFLEDLSLYAVISSFFLSTSFFEINQSRKSWVYLREALTLAQDMGLHKDSSYDGLGPEESLCRLRVFWQLFVTERSFAILRNKPITLKKTPALPTTCHPYESPHIHSGFLQLISSYVPLDEAFVTAWNEGSDPHVTAATYLALQDTLSLSPAFLSCPGQFIPSAAGGHALGQPTPAARVMSGLTAQYSALPPGASEGTTVGNPGRGISENQRPEPTSIQKADLLITQQWLRLIVWQSSFRQGLLSWAASHESMHFAFPLTIARQTASVLQALPSTAVEVHGMGIFEKIFEIGTWCINVLGAYDTATSTGTPIAGAGTPAGLGMDFLSGEVGALGVGRKGGFVDPLEFFVRTLSASPNSRTQFAERLLLFAGQRPGGMKMALSPALSLRAGPSTVELGPAWGLPRPAVGSVLGEVMDGTEAREGPGRSYRRTSSAGSAVAASPARDREASQEMHDAPLTSPTTSSIVGGFDPMRSGYATPEMLSPVSGWSAGGYEHHTRNGDNSYLASPDVKTEHFTFPASNGRFPH